MHFSKSKLILGFALTAMLASCGGSSPENIITWDDKYEGAEATSHYLEFARKTYDLVNLKVNTVYNGGAKVYETIVGTSERSVTIYDETYNYEEWVWIENDAYYYACKDSYNDTEFVQDQDEYNYVYRSFKKYLEDISFETITKIEYTHAGTKVVRGDALVSGDGKMTYKMTSGTNYILVEADTDGEFIKTLTYKNHDDDYDYTVSCTFIREGEFVFEKPDTAGWSTAN